MKRLRFAIIFALLLFCSCSKEQSSEVYNEIVTTSIVSQQATKTEIETIESDFTATTKKYHYSDGTTTAEDETENQMNELIIQNINIDLFGGYYDESYVIFNGSEYITYKNEIEFLMKNASKIYPNTVGNVSDEQDLITKAREVFTDLVGQEYIERAESDYIISDDERKKIIRDNPYYRVKYYEEYDTWYINPCMPSGKTDDGQSITSISDNPPFLIIRGADGKIIASRF